MATITKVSDGDISLGNLRGELITLQPAASDYAAGGYLIQGISGSTETTGDVGLSKVLFVEPAGGQGGLSPVWNPATSKVQIIANAPSAGIPLGLGTLSAAATNSTYTAAGLVTILTSTPPPLNSFVSFSNGASGKGIFLNGVIGLVTGVVAGTSYTVNFGQGVALAYASAADTLKYQVVQAGAGNPLQAQALAAQITGVLATANLLTITQANSLQVGQFVYLNGPFKAASVYALGAIVQVASATATGWTANWQGTIIAQTSAETAVASLLVTNGGVPIQSYPYISGPTAAISNVLAVASGAAASGLLTLTATQNYQAGQIAVLGGVATTTLLNGTIGTIIATGLTSALVKMNGWTVIVSTAADTGSVALLVTGTPPSPQLEVSAGTDLSAYAFQLLCIGL
jgi:hypothetical protein